MDTLSFAKKVLLFNEVQSNNSVEGYYDDIEEIKSNWSVERAFASEIDEEMRSMLLSGWETAVKRVLL